MTIGDRIRNRRDELGLSADDLAEKLGKSRATIYRYENGEIEKLPTTVLEPLAVALNTTPAYLMGWDDPPQDNITALSEQFDNIHPIKLRKFPLLGEIACGKPIFADEDRESFVMADNEIKADFCLRAKGDSMINARICDGDIVFIHSVPMVENGEIAAVIINDEATLKRVYYYPKQNKLILTAENPAYEPLVYMNEELEAINILGKAVCFMSEL